MVSVSMVVAHGAGTAANRNRQKPANNELDNIRLVLGRFMVELGTP
jgi:hypothetical protein